MNSLPLAAYDILFDEIPNEISLTFFIAGCRKACKGCHSPRLWNERGTEPMTESKYDFLLNKYKDQATCVLFMGGEWYPDLLVDFLYRAKQSGYKTALYTGEEDVDVAIREALTFLKTGPFKEELGGLDSATTNQRLVHLPSNENLNHYFQKDATCL